ncbi:MAG: efflux RND transporter permease subunit [Hyphomicrobiales bacterium]|jgi:multidrug efflux pump|nr:efflux RND transporter permease subunit [Hyphomicrobiales bacterium]
MVNLSEPFIKRPIATTLMAAGLMFAGLLAYLDLPVSSLPAVDFPTIRVSASRPGADPATMAATVAAPLERRLGEIAGVTEITSTSSLGNSAITIQFDVKRKIDNAARDVQAALNAAATDLPSDLPSLPVFRKTNPAAAPVLVLAIRSDSIPTSDLYDISDSVIAQRIAQVAGVAEVTVNGAEQPAIRVKVDPARLAAMGLGIDEVRAALVSANALGPVGSFDGENQAEMLATNAQLVTIEDFKRVIVAVRNSVAVTLGDVADVRSGVRNTRAAGWFNGKPAVLLIITKQPQANVIETVDKVKALIPELRRWIPASVEMAIVSDRTSTIRASISDLMVTLCAAIVLVMLVVWLFLRRGAQILAVGMTVPLSLAGSFAAMWVAGFTLDNLSLLAITISVGFVVDDAIVVVENIHAQLERGATRLQAALEGARQIGFTVFSISLSLIAAFIPMLFLDGAVGRMFREFALTLAFAIAVSTFVSLTVAPMICSRLMKRDSDTTRSRLDQIFEQGLEWLSQSYQASLIPVLRHPWLTILTFVLVIGASVALFRALPKGGFPQDDTGLIFGFTEASADVSFGAMIGLQQRVADIVLADPAVASASSFIGASGGIASVNQGRILISLKPFAERGISSNAVVIRLRKSLAAVTGIWLFMVPVQDLRVGGRVGKSPFQFTLWGQDLDALQTWAPRAVAALKAAPELVDVSTDKINGGLQLNLVIDRTRAAQLGVKIQAIDAVLGDSFGQKQVATLYSQRNQYRVVMESDRQRDPNDLNALYVTGTGGVQVPLSTLVRFERGISPLLVNHQGQFPAITITYDVAPNVSQDAAFKAVRRVIEGLHLPDTLNSDFAGDAKAFSAAAGTQGLLILAAFVAVYLILGILYESLVHPLTIISTLPSAGLGALLSLWLFGMELTLIAMIGIILLIGIVKKNGIMLVDFAIAAQREQQLSPYDAIYKACGARFRPILMTTLAALLGALPLVLAMGPGAELRRPLGVTIIGGLVLSQLLTLYTTPVIYLMMDRFSRKKTTLSNA